MGIVEDVKNYIQKHKDKSGKTKIKIKVLRDYLHKNKPFVCCYCGVTLSLRGNCSNNLPDNYLTLEHIKPMSHYFGSDWERSKVRQQSSLECNQLPNLTLICFKCNEKMSHENLLDRKEQLGLLCRLK